MVFAFLVVFVIVLISTIPFAFILLPVSTIAVILWFHSQIVHLSLVLETSFVGVLLNINRSWVSLKIGVLSSLFFWDGPWSMNMLQRKVC